MEPVHRLDNLGLGELTVKSRLGEPMLAELELFGSALRPDKALHVAVFADSPVENASPSAAQRHWSASVTHRLLKRASGHFVLQLRSSEPVTDPVLAFRLEVAIANVKAQKQFLLLLEPQVESHRAPDANKHVARRSRPVSHGVNHGLKAYRVVQGDTLSSIAQRIKGHGTVVDIVRQLYRANPQAFANSSPNSLQAGALLHYPAEWGLPETYLVTPEAERHASAATAPAAKISAASAATVGSRSASQPHAAASITKPLSVPVATLEQQLKQQDKVLERVGAKAGILEDRLRKLSVAESRPASSAVASAGSVAPAPVAMARPSTPPAKPVAASMPSTQPVLDDDDHRMLYGGAAATTLLAALLLLRQRQKKRAVAGLAAAGQASSSGKGESLHGASLFFEGDNLSGSELVELTGDDPIAEAEVYMAYGRTDQALEVLREGLVREPLRQDLRYKLLEVLAAQPDLDVFIAEATSAKGILGHSGLLWQRVCELGQKVAPDHPLFVLLKQCRCLRR
ncbi:type IV pilus assembly protein FimV [Paludibacterium denitrificans]|uniref:LysM domain-containing protein n=1 Tax=Paludibacterium denitrificans TaxID=2675226 RepID=A0A844GDP6_9NEIS|nr:LysM peptidoglycan-binding domain-containing protein [Paludibacterium denitrificans]MTD33779.1 hypothetical protein [Paludibacterium denitrificans]